MNDLAPLLAARGFPCSRIDPLAGDASSRRYARVALADGGSAILVFYPAEIRSAAGRFLHSTELLATAGVPVPRVLACDPDHAWMLVEDLGERTLAERRDLGPAELAASFAQAAELARRIARLPAAAVAALNPPLDGALLRRELEQTRDALLAPRGLLGDAATSAGVSALFDEICALLGAEPAVPCHRDFMARNLIPREARGGPDGAELAVIDHQDLRLGPPHYDLASLLNDTLFPPPGVEQEIVTAAAPTAAERESYHRTAAQRTFKAAGSFAKLAERGVARHLPLIPETLARGLAHLGETREGAAWAPRLAELWRPALP
ncbi:MAG TPA: phosphotransferase [Thermoanaerobaculia bacterium]|nr:phosphotransferase [Thermoanaerobaculia bacterium]